MNIYALKGHKVVVTEATAKNGYDSDVQKVRENLSIGKIYTVKKTIVENSRTKVFLEEIPEIPFNSSNFEDVNHQSKIFDMQHPDYHLFHNYNRNS